ncbi:MAG: hypothetical protein H0W73_03460 [Bacteroidetes bacterium]|nr:hypothetical protein [Bacteroidota bacterium]
MKKSLLLLALLFTTLLGAQPPDKKLIDTSEVSYVEIVKFNSADPARSQTKKLSKKQYAGFAQKWNSAPALGADKYKMTYYLYLYTKAGQKRQFTIFANKIQEGDWLTFDLKDKQYFDILWKGIK